MGKCTGKMEGALTVEPTINDVVKKSLYMVGPGKVVSGPMDDNDST